MECIAAAAHADAEGGGAGAGYAAGPPGLRVKNWAYLLMPQKR